MMKRDETGKDRLMDALLREDAKGGEDESFLAEVEQAIDSKQGREEEPRRGAWTARPWAWAAAAASIGVVAGYVVLHEEPGGALVSSTGEDYRTTSVREAPLSAPEGRRIKGQPPVQSPHPVVIAENSNGVQDPTGGFNYANRPGEPRLPTPESDAAPRPESRGNTGYQEQEV